MKTLNTKILLILSFSLVFFGSYFISASSAKGPLKRTTVGSSSVFQDDVFKIKMKGYVSGNKFITKKIYYIYTSDAKDKSNIKIYKYSKNKPSGAKAIRQTPDRLRLITAVRFVSVPYKMVLPSGKKLCATFVADRRMNGDPEVGWACFKTPA